MKEHIDRYPRLAECADDVEKICDALEDCFRAGGKLLLCGNGGSAADCEHITGELTKGFLLERKLDARTRAEFINVSPQAADIVDRLQYGLPAIPLPALMSLTSAVANDYDPAMMYAQGVMSLGREGDALLCISTSGNSESVYNAAVTAKAKGMFTAALTGKNESLLSHICDATVRVPETETYKVQELHLPLYHAICAELERRFFRSINCK